MSYSEIMRATSSLEAVVRDIFKLEDEAIYRLVEAIEDVARVHADQEIDRLFNRGDFR